MTQSERRGFAFRPWVRRAGLSIVLVALFATAAIVVLLTISPSARFGWIREPFVWIYIGVLWLGGLRIFLGTLRPIVEMDGQRLLIRPLHQFVTRSVPWSQVRGTEQSGDRLIIYFETLRGMRFVALNLNLVKGRRDFLALLDERLKPAGGGRRVAGGPPPSLQ